MISELRVTTVAVSDVLRSCTFYADAFGYQSAGGAAIAGPEIERAWQMPAGLTGRCRVVGPPGATTGLLRLVQFDQPGQRIVGGGVARPDGAQDARGGEARSGVPRRE